MSLQTTAQPRIDKPKAVPTRGGTRITVKDARAIRRLAGSDLGQFEDVYVAGTDGVKRFRASGVALGLSADGVTGRAYLKNGNGHYEDVYAKTPEGDWRFKSRVHVADAR